MLGIQRDEPIVTVAHYTWQIIGVCDRNFGIESGYGGITGTDNQTDTILDFRF
ncbi:hypothetical protein [Nostoc sp.]|uniref:hypothetical protein n=1 Tax=Nostoc sp. TaxID=1180 RepID=UPI00269AB24E